MILICIMKYMQKTMYKCKKIIFWFKFENHFSSLYQGGDIQCPKPPMSFDIMYWWKSWIFYTKISLNVICIDHNYQVRDSYLRISSIEKYCSISKFEHTLLRAFRVILNSLFSQVRHKCAPLTFYLTVLCTSN